ncbi:MAG: hypothetical protein NT062_21700 [Proteobacteria bacterium]|nr:hypothetical protein [Pseudomonadota bacterium]
MRIVLVWLLFASVADAAPRDFTAEARAVYAVVACGEAPPPTHDGKTIAAHCGALAKITAPWQAKWRAKAAPFFATLLGKRTNAVVYPFGGGDLASALVVYPDATDYTTLSLEGMGDPRPIARMTSVKVLAPALSKLRTMLAANLGWAWNTTSQLSIDSSETGAGLPGILAVAMVALAANGYEPLVVRYFRLGPGGAITYVDDVELAAWDGRPSRRTGHKADQALQVGLFNDVEITFRRKDDATAPAKTFRHIAADLSDHGDQATFDFLDAKRDVVAMTKAASYLLWKPEFSKLRGILLARMVAMVSDDTGIPPRFAKPAGFTQDVWGTYAGAFFAWADDATEHELVAYWKANTKGSLPFRFGYYDRKRTSHLMFTHK